MKLTRLIIAITVAALGVACGSSKGDYSGYKAENSIEGSDNPTSFTNTANSPAEMDIGDIFTVTFDKANEGIVDFDGTDSSAQFIFAVSAIDAGQNTHTFQMNDESVQPSEAVINGDLWKDIGTNEAFEDRLRNLETELSITEPIPETLNIAKGIAAPSVSVNLGDIDTFQVLSSLSSLSTYKSIRAKVKCVGENVIFYIDTEVDTVSPNDLTQGDVDSLCEEFDTAAGREFNLYGETSYINNDGKVAVLMTPQVNRLGASGGGIITGFFFANDLYSGLSSNLRELIYTLVPDPSGRYGVTIPKSFAMDNLLPAVLPHELQHAVNYNQKVFVNNVASEENWLNESLSHLSEDLTGFGMENPSRSEVYMLNPSYYGPIVNGSPNLAERGAGYLFLRYLYEQAADGDLFVKNLLQSNKTGVANLEAAFAGTDENFDQVSEFLLRWNITMIMSSFNLSSDERFTYQERTLNETTGNYEGVCLNCDVQDGRGTILDGISLSKFYSVAQVSLEPASSVFYKLTSFPTNVELKTSNAGLYAATLVRYK